MKTKFEKHRLSSKKSFETLSEFEEIKQRIQELERKLEKIPDKAEKEELIKKEIKQYLEELQKSTLSVSPHLRDELKEIQAFSQTEQVGALVTLALEKGIKKALFVAKKLKNPAILDEFHDVLIDRYYQMLVKKGLIKPN
ncbi:hypothetical protein H5T58_00395 [Candidatus Parcubacteria bacterium]|nr:hypothetical protein [Candidatus Parcubacteria bacterium]